MKTAHKTLLVSMFSLGLATATVALAGSPPQFAGPRNTIRLVESGLSSSRTTPAKESTRNENRDVRAANEAERTCETTRVVHHGSPSKGYDQIERAYVACGRTRVAER